MVDITCPNCAADLVVPPAPIHTCDYCGTAIQVSAMVDSGATGKGAGPASEAAKAQYIIKDHYIIRCQYTPTQVTNLLIDWVKKIPGAPQDFENVANINKRTLKFYPMWVGEYSATSDYVGIDDWPKFSTPAPDKPGWYEHVSYYPKEESGRIDRQYQIPLMALDVQKLPKYLKDYTVTTTGKVYFDIQHVKKLGGEIIDSIYKMDEAKDNMYKQVVGRQTAEMHKEVKKITNRNDNITEKDVFYLHFPLYEMGFVYNGKTFTALIDGSNGRIVNVDVPISKEFRAKTLGAAGGFIAAGLVMLIIGLTMDIMQFFLAGGGIGLAIIGMMFVALNLRKQASEKQR